MIHLLARSLGSNCRVSTSDLKVRIEATDLSTFPDVTVVCGARHRAANDSNSVTNPTLLVEVTSRSTEDYDRGEKLRHYKHLESLKAVLFVSHNAQRVSIVERTEAGWSEREVHAGQDVVLADPALSFPLDELYRGVQLDA
jgi:Uma2 family endonuclease